MDEFIKVKIITPEQVIFDDFANIVIIPGIEGELAVMKDHMNMISSFKAGIVKVENNNTHHFFLVSGGLTEIFNECTLLAEEAYNLTNLSKDEIENLIINLKSGAHQIKADEVGNEYIEIEDNLDPLKSKEVKMADALYEYLKRK